MKNSQAQEQTLAMRINAAIALPLKISRYLVTPVIDVLINIPVMNAVWRERRELELLTDEHIKDIGLNSGYVRLETKKGYFNIPSERKRKWSKSESAFSTKLF